MANLVTRARTAVLAATLFLCGSVSALAQGPSTVATPRPECTDLGTQFDVASLADQASKGEWVSLSAQLKQLRLDLDAAKCLADGDERIIVVFPGKDGLGERILHSIVFPVDEPFSQVLPGLTGEDKSGPQLYEVFIADRQRASLKSTYVATKQDDPLNAQAISAVSANFGTLLGLAGGLVGSPRILASTIPAAAGDPNTVNLMAVDKRKSEPPPPKSYVSVSQVNLSAARSKVEATRRAFLPPSAKDIVDGITKLASEVKLREARDSAVALSYAGDMPSIAEEALKSCAAAMQKAVVDCRVFLETAAADRFKKVLLTDREAVEETNLRFRNYIADLAPTKVDQKSTLTNEPKRRVGLEAMTAYVYAAGGKIRVKANGDGSKTVVDPLPRAITAVGVSIKFKKFQPSIPDSAKGFSAYIGPTLTPNLGLAVALSYRVINGLSITTGGAFLAIPTGDLDAAPPKNGKPFTTAAQPVGFVGLSFNVK